MIEIYRNGELVGSYAYERDAMVVFHYSVFYKTGDEVTAKNHGHTFFRATKTQLSWDFHQDDGVFTWSWGKGQLKQ